MAGTATIFDIQRFSIHDGPGIRTTVFFKGCSLSCAWCQNPESLRARPELSFSTARCVDCRACVGACPVKAIGSDRERRVDWTRCNHCGDCAGGCPAGALTMLGQSYTVEEVVAECLRDREFFHASGGGVTLSGGEAVLQSAFLRELIEELSSAGVHTLLQTAGNYAWRLLHPLLERLDAIYFDWKAPASTYREHTGADATRVLDNLERLMRAGFPVTVRTLVVPGVNSEPEQIFEMCEPLTRLGITEIKLLSYNHLWEAKLPRLGASDRSLGLHVCSIDLERVAAHYEACGIRAICPPSSTSRRAEVRPATQHTKGVRYEQVL